MNNEQPAQRLTDEASDAEQQENILFPIVGIAASAGGLEAFIELLTYLPIDTGMAFVLIQHLAPDHKSLLKDILERKTQMPVTEVIDGVVVEQNHVYVITPNTKMILAQGRLRLAAREKVDGKYMPGDAFFNSLAAERGNKAIAVILSGGDGDGSAALTAIKAAGGVTFAQCEGTAKFDSMPNTAVATGNVDFVLPPQKIAEELVKLSIHPFIAQPPIAKLVQSPQSNEAMPRIFALLKSSVGVDFSQYKLTTLTRRIERRMLLYKLVELEDYAQYLQANPLEVKALQAEILIHVTSFFREASAFQLLKEQVFPVIAQNKSAMTPIRIWIAGCSTGEEAYSVAMCLLEFLGAGTNHPPIQIFATDISEKAIAKARIGIYRESQMEDVSLERRQRFFIKLDSDRYQVSKAVRELCVFARQDLNSDPPFSNLDLVSCRNVLIYFGEALQKQIVPIFHYSLNPTGFLMLGISESTGKYTELFTLIDKRHKIYSKKITRNLPAFSFVSSTYLSSQVDNPTSISSSPENNFDLQKETDRAILNRYAPVGVTIDGKMNVLQLRGETNFYLRLAPGEPSFNLFKMVREDLRVVLRAAVYQAQRQDTLVRKERLRVEDGDRTKIVNLEVIPFTDATSQEPYFVVLFAEATPRISDFRQEGNGQKLEPSDLEQEVIRLSQELATANQERAAAHEYLQAVIQEQEQINQDLKVANEEILSSNEELQSTNEELETAKEEIQSTNEELNTTNEELRSRNLELHDVNNDVTNLLASIDIPILMLTNDLRVRRFTPTAQKLFSFISTDIGRPFRDINAHLDIPNLEDLIVEVMNTLSSKELEVQTTAGSWYNLHIRPYRTLDNRIEGAVVVLIDIDTLKRSATKLEAARNYAEAIIETITEPLVVLDTSLNINTVNSSFYQTFQVSQIQTENHSIFELGNGQWNIPQLRSLLEEVLPQSNQIDDFEVEHTFEQIGRKTMLLNARKIRRTDNQEMILLVIQDITERKLFERQRDRLLTTEQAARSEAEIANQAKDEFLSIVSHELRNPLTAILGWTELLRKHKLDSAKTEQALEIVDRSARSQAQLIEDILDTSRITTGKLQLNLKAIALAPVIESAIDVAHPSAEAKNISIEAVLEPEPIQVSGDPDRLQQIIGNLLSNAIKFTPAKGRITVKLERLGSFAQIEVSDTGQGISADFLPHVFERFRQANSSSTRSEGGLGLGLSIVGHLVELHGGTVSATSLGKRQGATFTVQLPLLKTKPEAKDFTLSPPPLSVSLLEGLQLLVVDDEEGLLELIKTILEYYGANVTGVTSAKDAIASLTNNPGRYDVLLSDIGMPKEDGYALIRQVRELSAELGGLIPAAALTAYVRGDEQSETLRAGFQKHIAKPVDSDQLVSIIAELAQRSPVTG